MIKTLSPKIRGSVGNRVYWKMSGLSLKWSFFHFYDCWRKSIKIGGSIPFLKMPKVSIHFVLIISTENALAKSQIPCREAKGRQTERRIAYL